MRFVSGMHLTYTGANRHTKFLSDRDIETTKLMSSRFWFIYNYYIIGYWSGLLGFTQVRTNSVQRYYLINTGIPIDAQRDPIAPWEFPKDETRSVSGLRPADPVICPSTGTKNKFVHLINSISMALEAVAGYQKWNCRCWDKPMILNLITQPDGLVTGLGTDHWDCH